MQYKGKKRDRKEVSTVHRREALGTSDEETATPVNTCGADWVAYWVCTAESISASGELEFVKHNSFPFLSVCLTLLYFHSTPSLSPEEQTMKKGSQVQITAGTKLHWCKRSVISQICFVNLECLQNVSRGVNEEGHHRVNYYLLAERTRGGGKYVIVTSLTALNFRISPSCQIYFQVLTSKSLKERERNKEGKSDNPQLNIGSFSLTNS